MSKDKLTDYSATNASNTDIGGINIDEGMLPSDVNNALREVMTHLKNFSDGTDAVDGISFGDNAKAIFGSVSDGLQIYNTSSGDKIINEAGSGNLKLQGDNLYLQNSAGTENHIIGITGGAVTLHHNASSKLATTSTGVDVTGVITTDGMTTSADINFGDNDKAIFGAGSDLQIWHNSSNGHSLIQESGTGSLFIDATDLQFRNSAGQIYANATSGGSIVLRHAGSEKLATTSSGVDVTGTVTADGLTVEAATGDATLRVHAAEANSSSEPILVLESSNDFAESIVEFKDSSGVGGRVAYNHGDNALRFQTNGVAERMRLDGSGNLMVGTTDSTQFSNSGTGNDDGVVIAANAYIDIGREGNPGLYINRTSNDGELVAFLQDGTQEGSISVSGTTVSLLGGHLSRWSQATDGNRIDGLVKGTVMTNLDQMAVWHHEAQPATYYEEGDELPEGVSVGDEKTPAVDAYDEDNEQLNCMAVSSVEGDANVAGVFVNWDDDDTDFTADMNVAMTGDMVIRIAQGTTVARGDLLMSAGDGTAKPQGDDIVRSKTIAKVTSTTVSHTYDDGTYLVPCVLMAC